jgi:RimJ/RimL family protein N-acetyltransferase
MQRDWEEHGFGRWAVEERESGRLLGHAGLGVHHLWPGDPELGWGIDPERWGLGYATEAAAAALEHAWSLGIARVVSLIHPDNAASLRVAEKLGEHLHATVPWPAGGHEVLVYAVESPA